MYIVFRVLLCFFTDWHLYLVTNKILGWPLIMHDNILIDLFLIPHYIVYLRFSLLPTRLSNFYFVNDNIFTSTIGNGIIYIFYIQNGQHPFCWDRNIKHFIHAICYLSQSTTFCNYRNSSQIIHTNFCSVALIMISSSFGFYSFSFIKGSPCAI